MLAKHRFLMVRSEMNEDQQESETCADRSAGGGDYAAFEKVLLEAVERTETRLLAYCLLPNHWHLVPHKCRWAD